MNSIKDLITRGFKVYNQHGLKRFFFESFLFIWWSILPESKAKRLFSRSKILSEIYFFIFGGFYFEKKTILQGKAKNAENPSSRTRMIRLTHGLEKGLSARNRREIFFEDKIDELLYVLEEVILRQHKSNDSRCELDRQTKWVIDTVNMYFSVVSKTQQIESSHSNFNKLIRNVGYKPSSDKTPHLRKERPQYLGSFDNFRILTEQRTSTRWFTDEPVSKDDLDQAIDAALQSPSACNKQSYEFKIYNNKEDIVNICNLALGAHGFKHNIPCLIVLVGKQRAYSRVRDKHNVYIDASLASMTFQYALETIGLASCCINWHSNIKRDLKISKLLSLDGDETVIMLMAVGHPDPDDNVAYSEKRPLEQMRTYEELED